jgi:hypothetical protein
MASLSPQQIEAAQDFAVTTIAALKTAKGVHAETAVAAAARMAGTFLFRSFNFPAEGVEAGQAVLSDQANEQGPRLVQIAGGVLTELGVVLDDKPVQKGPKDKKRPARDFLETQRKLEPRFAEIAQRLGLSLREAADSAAVATALVIREMAKVLDPNVAFGIAVYGFVEGAKTAPDSVVRDRPG